MALYDGIMVVHATIDKAGRVVIPKDLREALHLQAGDLLQMQGSGEGILLTLVREQSPLVKKQGIWIHRGGGTLSAAEVEDAISGIREHRDRHNTSSEG